MKYWKVNGDAWEDAGWADDYTHARCIGSLRVGENALFFKSRLKTYAVPYNELDRIYRRVVLVPARMCCGKGDLAVEYIVLEKDGAQLAQIQMPGERAGKAALEELKGKAPHAQFVCPDRNSQEAAPK